MPTSDGLRHRTTSSQAQFPNTSRCARSCFLLAYLHCENLYYKDLVDIRGENSTVNFLLFLIIKIFCNLCKFIPVLAILGVHFQHAAIRLACFNQAVLYT